jgi:hypothetical protein
MAAPRAFAVSRASIARCTLRAPGSDDAPITLSRCSRVGVSRAAAASGCGSPLHAAHRSSTSTTPHLMVGTTATDEAVLARRPADRFRCVVMVLIILFRR